MSYAKAGTYLMKQQRYDANLLKPNYLKSQLVPHKGQIVENFSLETNSEKFSSETPQTGYPNPEKPLHGFRENLTLEWKTDKYSNTKDPEVFGPPLWLTLHNAAAHYPENPSPIMISQMMNYIKGLPAVLPCEACKEHATAHIQANLSNLPDICSCRNKLEEFFVTFHNYVNKKYNKPIFTIEQARKMYRGGAEVRILKY